MQSTTDLETTLKIENSEFIPGLESVFEPREALLLRYVQKLTREPWKMAK